MISIPDGLNALQVQTILDARRQAQTRSADLSAFDSSSTLGKFGIGVAKPFVETGLGIKDLAGRVGIGDGLDDEDKASLERLHQTHGFAAGAGDVAGNLATFLIPAGAGANLATRAVGGLPRALARFAPVASDMAVSAGMEGLKAPTDDESRGSRALGGALGAGVGHAVSRVLAPVLRPFDASSGTAEDMLNNGVPLTPGQARGGVARWLEDKLAGIPGVGGPIRARQAEAVGGWNKSLLNDVVPEGEVTAAGHKGFQQAKSAFSSAYDKLWDGDIPLDVGGVSDGWNALADSAEGKVAPDALARVRAKLADLHQNHLEALSSADGGSVAGSGIDQLDDALRKLGVTSARQGDSDVAGLYFSAKKQLRDALPDETSDELSRIDGLYRKFAVTQRAASYKGAAKAEGVFTPDQLLSAAIAKDRSAGKSAVAAGTATFQPEATQAGKVLGDSPGALSDAEKLGLGFGVYHNPALAATVGLGTRGYYSKTFQDVLRGDGPMTSAMAASLRRLGISPGILGAAVEDDVSN